MQSRSRTRFLLWALKNKIILIFGLIVYMGCIALILSVNSNDGNLPDVRQISVAFTVICLTGCLTLLIFFHRLLSKIIGRNTVEKVGRETDQPKYDTISLDDEKCRSYLEILENTMNTTKIYLRPGLSLDELSTITKIPKHHFSNLLNVHIGKTFYQYISEYRIQEAMFRMENDENITVESLSYECGFNSKTSFNRYFKNATGTTPSEYRKVRIVS